MSKFLKLTRHDGVGITINADRVRYVIPQGDKTQVIFAKDDILLVQEHYTKIVEQLGA